MAAYRVAGYRVTVHRPARPYRRPRRYKSPYGRRGNGTGAVVAIVAGALAATGTGAHAVITHAHAKKAAPVPAAANAAAAKVTAFAAARVGEVPYLWGGTTDAGMDCAGLAQAAYASAHVTIERTSQQQWASERRVPASKVVAGDLVFFAGSDGTPSAPGHVGIVTDPARHQMIDAYAKGTYVRYDYYGPAASPVTGLSDVTGFTDPAPQAPASPARPAAPGTGDAGNVTLGRRLAAAYGWSSGAQWTCLYDLWERESGWQADIANPQSGAFGIAQALGHGGTPAAVPLVRYPDGSTAAGVTVNEYPSQAANSGDARAQIKWGLSDVKAVYGTPCAAWSHEEAMSWY